MRSLAVCVTIALTGCVGWGADLPDDGPALDLPRLSQQPKLDGAISDGEWDEALRIEGVFVISDGSLADGAYPFEIFAGFDENALHIAVWVKDLGPQPFKNEWTMPDRLEFYFNKGSRLEGPGDTIDANHFSGYGRDVGDGYWNGEIWGAQPDSHLPSDRSEFPSQGRRVVSGDHDDGVVWEAYIQRTSPYPQWDGLQLDGPTTFRMLLILVRQNDLVEGPVDPATDPDRHQDSWPGDGWNPMSEKRNQDPSTWLVLRIPE